MRVGDAERLADDDARCDNSARVAIWQSDGVTICEPNGVADSFAELDGFGVGVHVGNFERVSLRVVDL